MLIASGLLLRSTGGVAVEAESAPSERHSVAPACTRASTAASW